MMIANNFKYKWFSYFRCSNADDEAFDLIKESGCKALFLGIESGNQSMLDNMNKHATVQEFKEGIRKLKEREIFTYASFVVGFPGENRETVQDTIRFIEETQPDGYEAEIYFHSLLPRFPALFTSSMPLDAAISAATDILEVFPSISS